MNSRAKFLLQLGTILLLTIAIALVARNGFAWTSPASNPPGGSGILNVNNGNVGIGTPTPGTKLTIQGGDDAATIGVLELLTTGGTNLKLGGNMTYSWIQSYATKPLYINQLGNNVVLNIGSGNVGIGTAAPNYKLEVNGTISGSSVLNPTYAP